MCRSYLAVWIISGVLQGAVVLASGNPLAAMVLRLIFITLGLVGVGASDMKQQKR